MTPFSSSCTHLYKEHGWHPSHPCVLTFTKNMEDTILILVYSPLQRTWMTLFSFLCTTKLYKEHGWHHSHPCVHTFTKDMGDPILILVYSPLQRTWMTPFSSLCSHLYKGHGWRHSHPGRWRSCICGRSQMEAQLAFRKGTWCLESKYLDRFTIKTNIKTFKISLSKLKFC